MAYQILIRYLERKKIQLDRKLVIKSKFFKAGSVSSKFIYFKKSESDKRKNVNK